MQQIRAKLWQMHHNLCLMTFSPFYYLFHQAVTDEIQVLCTDEAIVPHAAYTKLSKIFVLFVFLLFGHVTISRTCAKSVAWQCFPLIDFDPSLPRDQADHGNLEAVKSG